MEIKDKVVIVTGASQGIGLETAKYLNRLGAKVVMAARSKELMAEAAKDMSGEVLIVKADMTKPSDVKNLIDTAIEKFDRVDVLINNAGQGMYEPFESMKIEDFKNIMELNLFSVVMAMQAIIPVMRKQGGGTIINVSSGVTKMYIPMMSAYSATKYALNAVSFISRSELEKDKIVVSLIRPKMTATNFGKNLAGGKSENRANRGDLQIDTAEFVAEKIAELIKSGDAEITL